MPRITELFCFAINDTDPEDEGVPAFDLLGGVPMIGADMARVEDLIPLAQRLSDESGKQIRIYKFSQREQIGTINPRSPQ